MRQQSHLLSDDITRSSKDMSCGFHSAVDLILKLYSSLLFFAARRGHNGRLRLQLHRFPIQQWRCENSVSVPLSLGRTYLRALSP
jgi:hypothetical protein